MPRQLYGGVLWHGWCTFDSLMNDCILSRLPDAVQPRHRATVTRGWLLLCCVAGLHAQDPASANRAKAQPVNPATPSQTAPQRRLFFVLPNFLTVDNDASVPPMTVGQKFKTTAQNAFDPASFVWYGIQAGIGQLRNSNPSFGQGAQGYAKRYGLRFADGTLENFFTHAIYPTLFHQDPRYFRLGKGGFVHRAGYAVSRLVVTRSDSGRRQVNFSEILGGATAAGISTFSYHPEDSRNLHSALGVWGTQVGYDALSLALKEFWPDIRSKIHALK